MVSIATPNFKNVLIKADKLKKAFLFISLFFITSQINAQVCGTPGADGPVNISSSINTYYPISGAITLSAGSNSIALSAVAPTDAYGNSFGVTPIAAGDLILIIQMQDASINYTNTNLYGSGTSTTGTDGLGGTGLTLLGNSGIYEYVIATNNVPLSGGNLTFVGTGTGGGALQTYYNSPPTVSSGKKTFQIVRVPQFSNLTLNSNVTTPPFNGTSGGIIAFNVSGTFNFNGFTIDGNARGFRGGYSPVASTGGNNSSTYVGLSSSSVISGKGEGIAGTPRYMWDGFNQVDNVLEGMPGGSSGRGAPANAGGGGNDHNSGGGGGGNGGFGGLGGEGWQGGGGDLSPLTGGGRPGYTSYLTATPALTRLIMGGGGGAGDANNATNGVKGGVGGAIILINAGSIQGTGSIFANGGVGAPGTFNGSPDGAGGGGAGGSVFLNISNNSTTTITIQANGGNGGNTLNDTGSVTPHGPGGGGGGGIIRYNVPGSGVTINTSVTNGLAGKTNNGAGINHGAVNGNPGYVASFVSSDLPGNLQINSNCLAMLDTKVVSTSSQVCNYANQTVSYEIKITNLGNGNAAQVVSDFLFPTGIVFQSATAAYTGFASGPSGSIPNTGTAGNPLMGSFNIPLNGVVTISLIGTITNAITPGTYSANAQSLYLDPTRTIAQPNRQITPLLNSYGTVNTTYQTGGGGNVLGTNFSGSSTTVDDLTIFALPVLQPITGTSIICSGTTTTLANTTAGGVWSSSNTTVATIDSAGIATGLTAGTSVITYTFTDTNGCVASTTLNFTVEASQGGTVNANQTICTSGTPADLTLTGNVGTVVKWQSSLDAAFTTPTDIAETSTTLTGATIGALTSNTYFRAVVQNGACTPANSTAVLITLAPPVTIDPFSPATSSRCQGAGVVTTTTTATNSSGIIYSLDAASITGGNTINPSTGAVTYAASWSGTTTITASAPGCLGPVTTTHVVTVNPLPTATISYSSPSFCRSSTLTTPTPTITVLTGGPFTATGFTSTTGLTINATTGVINPGTSTAGTYTVTYTFTGANGCVNTATTSVTINALPTATISYSATTFCKSVTSATPTINVLTGGPFTATGFTSTTGLTINATTGVINPSTSTAGTYTVTYTFTGANGCVNTATTTVTINALPTATISYAGTPFCKSVTSVTPTITIVSGGPFTATGFTSTTGLTINATTGVINPSTSTAGTYTVTYTFTGNGCVNTATTSVTINALPTATISYPAATFCKSVTTATPTINVLTGGPFTATGFTSTTGLTINATTGIINPSTSTAGTYTVTYTFTGANGCVNTATTSVTIIALPTATISYSTPFCKSVASAAPTITVLTDGPFSATSFSSTAGLVINTTTGVIDPSTSTAGTYTITYTFTGASGCTNTATASVTIDALPNPPTPGTPTQPTCTVATGSVVLSGLPSGNWTINPGGITGNTTSTTISGLAPGTYNFTVTNALGCTSFSANVVINAQPATPVQPTLSAVTQPTCTTATGSFTISNYNASYTYTFTPSTGVVNNAGTVTAPAGTYTVTATLGACTSVTSASVTVNVQPATPVQPTLSAVTQPTCTTATGSFTISNYNAAYTYAVSPSTGVTVSGNTVTAPAGTYTVTATLGACTSVASANATVNAQPATPAQPTLSAVTQPTCTTATGSFTITNYNASYTYTVNPSTAVTVSGNTVTTPAGTYTVTATLGTCTSIASTTVTVNAQPATPAQPTLSAVTQPTCATATGSFTITNYNAAYTYTVNPSTGVSISGNTITAPAGTYTVTATLGACTSVASANVTVNAQPATPAQPTLSAVTQPTCATATGSFTITNYNAAYTYTVNPSTGVSISGNTITAPAGTYTVTATLGACTSVASANVTVNAQPATPAQPTLSAVTQPTCTVATGSFTIANYNAAYTYTVNPSTGVSISGNTITAPAGTYTVTTTLGACTSIASASVTVNAQPATPAQPTLSAVTQPTCSVATGSFTISNYNASYTYTVSPSTGVTVSGNTVTAPAGTYTVTATLGACTSIASTSVTVNAQPPTPAQPTLSAVTQPTCTTATGSFTISNYNAAYTYTVNPSTGVSISGNTITAPTGTYTVTATLGTCSSIASASVTVNTQPATPAQPTLSAITQPTCTTATGSFTITNYNAAYTYTVNPSTGVSISGNTVTAAAGTYTVTATLGTCTSVVSASVTVNAQPATPAQPTLSVVTQPTCTVATGSFTIANYNAAYTYTVNPSTGVSISGNTITAPAGTYTVTTTLGACTSIASASVTVNAQPATPAQPTLSAVTQPTCTTATGSFTITNYNASYTYTVNPSTGVTVSGNTVTAPAGTYTLTATLGACTSIASASVTVNAQPTTPTQPTLSTVTQPTCTTTAGSFTISNYNAAYTYTFTPSTGVVNNAGTVTAPAGTYTVTATLGPCSSIASTSVTINAQPATPAQPTLSAVTQPTCTIATGSFTINNYNATYTYTFSPSTGVVNNVGTVTAPAGTYTVTATLSSCTSVASASVTVNAQPATPAQPTLSAVTQPTCTVATGSFTINNYNAAYTYTFSPSTGVINNAGAVTAPAGTYTVTATLGACSSVISADIIIDAQPATPAQPTLSAVTQPTCTTATGSFTITNYNASYIYTVNPSTGVAISGDAITAPTGTYTVTATLGTCTSIASVDVIIDAQPATPAQPLLSAATQPTCTVATGSFTITNYNASYTYTVNPSTGVTVNGDTVTVPAGTYTVTATLGACTSITSADVVITASPATPAAPVVDSTTQPTCTVAEGSVLLSGLPIGSWTINPGGITGNTTSTTISGLTAGTYNFTVTNALGCTSVASADIIIDAQPSTPAQPTLSAPTQPTCTTASGSFTITNYNASYTYTVNPSTGVTISGDTVTASAGTYAVTATLGTCSSITSIDVIIDTQPATPTQPTLSAVTQPTCTIATGSFTITNYNAAYTYTVNPSTGVTISGDTVTAPDGTYTVTATLGACTSVASVDVVIDAQPATPAQPTLSAATQPTCNVVTGSFTITNYNASYTYTFTPSTGVINNAGTVTAPAGTYTVIATLGACTSVASTSVTVNAQPATPAQPTLSTVTQPTCTTATGSFIITNYNASYTYTVSPSTGVTISGDIITAPAGTYTITATLGTCSSIASADIIIDAQPATPAQPTLSAVTQPTCTTATGSFTISNYNASYTYTVSPSTGVTVNGDTVTAPAGTYTVTATLGTCSSVISADITIDIQPATPAQPTLSTVTQPTCNVATGSFTITNYNASYTYTVNPSTGVTISGDTVTASAGTYTVTATLATCTSIASVDVIIDAQPTTPAQPLLNAVTQPTCNVATGSFTITNYNASYTYTVNPSTGVTVNGDVITAPSGTYTVTATLATCTSIASVDVIIDAQPTTPAQPTLSAVTQPTCTTATGSFTITNYDAAYTYTVNPSTGATISGDTVTAPAGTYTVTATLGTCSSIASADVVITASPVTPTAPVVDSIAQPTCTVAEGSVLLSGLPIGNWTINPGGITGNTTSTTISGLAAGTYNFTVINTLGCTSVASTDVIIDVQPTTPAQPTLSPVTQPTCTIATGSFTITNYNAAYTYTVNPSTGVAVNGDTVTAPAGTYTVTTTLGACTSIASVDVIIDAQPATPAQPTLSAATQPTCTVATGSFTITNYNASYTYTVNPSTGVTISGDTVTAPAGTYTVTATLATCTSIASDDVVITASPATPAAPVVDSTTQPTCNMANGAVTLSGLPAGEWTINPGGITGSTPTVTLTGLIEGTTYNFTVTNSNGCTSLPTSDINIFNSICANDDTNSAPITAPTVPTVAIANVLLNNGSGADTLNGAQATTATVVISVQPGAIPGELTFNTSTGEVIVNAGTPAGTYTFDYTICEIANTSNCSTATVTVVVGEGTATIIAVNDTNTQPINGSNGGTAIVSVLTNDTLNGVPVLPTEVVISVQPGAVPGELTFNTTTGEVTVNAGTPAGTYTFDYTICETADSNNCSTATVTIVVGNAAITIVKSSTLNDQNGDGFAQVGETITYNFVVTNTGTLSLSNIMVTDPLVQVNGGPITLAAGTSDSTTFSAVYSINQADINAGEVINQAVVTADPSTGGSISASSDSNDPSQPGAEDPTITILKQDAGIALIKTATFNDENVDGHPQVGETITYHFVVTNTGNVTLTDIVITDPLPGVVITGGPISLASEEVDNSTFEGTYTITVEDIVRGSVTNQALVSGITPLGDEVTDLSDDTSNDGDNGTVLGFGACKIEVFNAVSPNDSPGLNDFFLIKGIECYPNNTVEIYNRWGVLVFELNGYNNTDRVFKGISEGRVTIDKSKGLPDGTYFYIIKYVNFSGVSIDQSGYLYIN